MLHLYTLVGSAVLDALSAYTNGISVVQYTILYSVLHSILYRIALPPSF